MFNEAIEFHQEQANFIKALKNKIDNNYSIENLTTLIFALKQLNKVNEGLITVLESQIEEEVKSN